MMKLFYSNYPNYMCSSQHLIMLYSDPQIKRDKLVTDIFRAVEDLKSREKSFSAKKKKSQIKKGKIYDRRFWLELTRTGEKGRLIFFLLSLEIQ